MEYKLKIEKRYINLRVKRGAEKIFCELWSDGKLARFFEFGPGVPDDNDFIVFYDLAEFAGKEILAKTNPELPMSIDDIFIQTDEPLEMDGVYEEKYRPLIHFTSKRGWLNDPNGLIFHNGKYHLFYQHNPFGVDWGSMHWGHAVSDDLFHWNELPEALYPDSLGTMYSGSAVICDKNKSHSPKIPADALVLAYTASGDNAPEKRENTQCLAFSTDGGMSFRKLDSNPVLPQITKDNRDPHVFWNAPTRTWIMTLYLHKLNAVIHEFGIFTSPDLLEWTETDRVRIPSYECPGLCELEVENSTGERKWVLWGAEGCYLVGDFDGRQFTPTQGALWDGTGLNGELGSAYAGQAFNNMPDGRCVKISWMRGGELPDMPFNQFMTLPVETTLMKTDLGYQLAYHPVRELENIQSKNVEFDGDQEKFTTSANFADSPAFDITLSFSPENGDIRFQVKGIEIKWDAAGGKLECLDRTAAAPLDSNGKLSMRIIGDVASLEIFAANGLTYLPIGKVLEPDTPILYYHSTSEFPLTEAKFRELKTGDSE